MTTGGSIVTMSCEKACWRVMRSRYLGTLSLGVRALAGPAITGGRWNSAGHSVLYTARTKELAALEMLSAFPFEHMNFALEGAEQLAAIPLTLHGLDVLRMNEFRETPTIEVTRDIGDSWLWERRTAALEVPSTTVHGRSILIFNPNHPDIERVTCEVPEPLFCRPNPFQDLFDFLQVMNRNTKEHDFFVCHAFEDKTTVVTPLVTSLEEKSVSLWVDDAQLRIGDSITEKVHDGLMRSRFVLVILTKTFLGKNFARKELSTALGIEYSDGKKRVIPVLAGSDEESQEVIHALPWLKDKLFVRWRGSADTQMVVEQLLAVVRDI